MKRDARAVAHDLHVQPLDEPRRLEAFVDERAQHGEQQRHQQRRGAAFAGDVAERQHEPAVGQRQDVVEVAADGVRRARHAAHDGVARGRASRPAASPAGCRARSRGRL